MVAFSGEVTLEDYPSEKPFTEASMNLDENGKPNRWRVENSWGKEPGKDGYYVMTDEWFNEYMFRLVVDKKYIPAEILKVLDEKPTMLPAWDPMFMPEE